MSVYYLRVHVGTEHGFLAHSHPNILLHSRPFGDIEEKFPLLGYKGITKGLKRGCHLRGLCVCFIVSGKLQLCWVIINFMIRFLKDGVFSAFWLA